MNSSSMQVFIYLFIFILKFDHPILSFLQIEFTFNFDFEKIEFQNRGISLVSLENEAKCWIFCAKWAKANFLLVNSPVIWLEITLPTHGLKNVTLSI